MDTGVLTGLAVLLMAAAALSGVALGRHLWPATRKGDTAALRAGEIEVARLTEECRAVRGRADQLDADHRAASSEAKAAAAEVARLTERENALSDRIAVQAAQLADIQKQLTAEFENIANRILRANACELSESSHKALAAVLDPLRERIRGASIYPAVQNIILACRALGLGTTITTNHIRCEDEVKALLGIPEDVATFALMPIGWPLDRFGPLTRRPLSEIAHADRWGAAWLG